MAQSGEGGTVADHLADQRKNHRQREQSDIPALQLSETSGAQRQQHRQHRQRRADQNQQRQADQKVDRHIQPRHVRHLVDPAGEDGADLVVKLGECEQAADRIERRQRRPRPCQIMMT